MTDAELSRFWPKISKDAAGCWTWTACITKPSRTSGGGYGLFQAGGRLRLAHRVSYEHFVGPIADGLQLDHLCRRPVCVNPQHLEPVSAQENQRRSPITFATINGAKTHCPQGHPYSEANLYVNPRGQRLCRLCQRERARQKNNRLKEQRRARGLLRPGMPGAGVRPKYDLDHL